VRQDTELTNSMEIPVRSVRNTHCGRYCSGTPDALEGTQNDEGDTICDDSVNGGKQTTDRWHSPCAKPPPRENTT
jgi:hypothetical protein